MVLSVLIFIGITVVTIFGDYFIKTSSTKPEGLQSLRSCSVQFCTVCPPWVGSS